MALCDKRYTESLEIAVGRRHLGFKERILFKLSIKFNLWTQRILELLRGLQHIYLVCLLHKTHTELLFFKSIRKKTTESPS